MQHDGKLDTCPFRGTLFKNKKVAREQLLQKNHENGSQHKDFNKNTYTSNTANLKYTIDSH